MKIFSYLCSLKNRDMKKYIDLLCILLFAGGVAAIVGLKM